VAEQTLIMVTKRCDLRAEAFGWSSEDASLFVPDKPIGFTPGIGGRHTYDNVLTAQAAGWKLLAPPAYSEGEEGWNWWLTRESES